MNHLILSFSLAILALAGCRKSHHSRPQERKYYSSYGPEVSKQDFEDQGKNGCVVENTRQGIQIRRTFVEGVLHGPSSWSFPHAPVVDYFEEYENGVLVSRGQNYENGSTRVEEQYGPSEVKIVRGWYEDGCPRMVEEFRADELVRGHYLTQDGDIETTVENANGMRVDRDRKGLLICRQQVVAGFPVVAEEFHSNGMLFQVYSLKNGAKDGVAKVYLESGEPQRLERWSTGQLHGEQVIYEFGSEVAYIPYTKGAREGIEKRLEAGTKRLLEEISWHRNLRHGPSVKYAVDGSKEHTAWFWRDTKVSEVRYKSYIAKQTAARAQINVQ